MAVPIGHLKLLRAANSSIGCTPAGMQQRFTTWCQISVTALQIMKPISL
jgi:hypothetical protein